MSAADRPLRRLLHDAPPSRGETAAALGFGVATIATGIGLMAFSAYLIQKAALEPPVLSLTVTIVVVRIFGITRGLFRYLERMVSHDAAFRLLGRLRVRFFAALVPLTPGALPARRTGDLLRRVVDDVDTLQNLFLRALGPPIVAAVTGLGTVLVVGAFVPLAGVALLVALLLGGLVVPLLAGRMGQHQGAALVEARAEVAAEVVDLLRAAPELALWGAGEAALDRVSAVDARARALADAVGRRVALLEALGSLAAGAAVVAVLAAGTRAVGDGGLDPVYLGLVTLTAMASFEAVNPLPAAFQALGGVRAAARRLYELVDTPAPVRDPDEPRPRPVEPVVTARELAARHGDDAPLAVDHLDLDLSPGRRVALLGPSGAGKSTVVATLLRFLPLAGGRLEVGGPGDAVGVADLGQDDVRGLFAVSGQDSHVFAGSVAANLRMARPDATDDELRGVLARVDLDGWLAGLPEGLDTNLGDDAAQASGGQRQRLLLARALLRDAPLMVLDEPTAHLDEPTEARLVADLLRTTGGPDRPGLLFVTHRLAGLDQMDEIVVLEHGQVIERGRAEDLRAADGWFAGVTRRLATAGASTDGPAGRESTVAEPRLDRPESPAAAE